MVNEENADSLSDSLLEAHLREVDKKNENSVIRLKQFVVS